MNIKNRIHTIREKDVMLDRDLAELYNIPTKRLNEQVKRNIERFPKDFMFQLNEFEKNKLVAKCDYLNNIKYSYQMPFVFTEHGVTALSGILKSKKAIEINILVIRAFVSMRHFIIQNASFFQKFQQIDQKLLEYDKNFQKIFETIENKKIIPSKGIFYDGQVFDAHKFILDLIKSAKKSIVLIDNYIDNSTLVLFSGSNIDIKIYTNNLTEKLRLNLKKYNLQYKAIKIIKFQSSHDRFLIIDSKTIYHFGASLKDLGKKWFAFSRFDKGAIEILNRLKS